ncbi:MAG: hypothetical protein GC193_10790, partial [Cryomorphaceae bacterium]|nr:hypothetical protein [Cryomorphaceae bacterium]
MSYSTMFKNIGNVRGSRWIAVTMFLLGGLMALPSSSFAALTSSTAVSDVKSSSLNSTMWGGATMSFTLSSALTSPAEQGDCDPNVIITCPGEVTIECTASINPDEIGWPSVSVDTCFGEEVVLNFTDEVISEGCTSVIARTWVATAGTSVDMCTQTITLIDLTGPEINIPADVLVQCIEEVPAPQEVSAEDACNDVTSIEIFTSETGFPIEE